MGQVSDSNLYDLVSSKRPSNGTSQYDTETILASLNWLEPGLLLWHELPRQTEFSLDLSRKRLTELTQDNEPYALLIDLTRAKKPSAQIREHMKKLFTDQHLVFVSVFIGGNLLIRIAARFVLGPALGGKAFSIVKDFSEARKVAGQALFDHLKQLKEGQC